MIKMTVVKNGKLKQKTVIKLLIFFSFENYLKEVYSATTDQETHIK